MVLDLRAEKQLGLGRSWGNGSLFARVFNVFDTKFFNGTVFESSGSAEFSRFPEADRVTLADPTRFFPPRRIEVGIRLRSGGL
jgi:hypothetical protein